ncbi:hypothetical protein B0H34DRAFT_696541 [Crassisporium funariophilum]|nr:hypothetical protein B0H34DRAFT_696541 [Crassisporium funariophilum]
MRVYLQQRSHPHISTQVQATCHPPNLKTMHPSALFVLLMAPMSAFLATTAAPVSDSPDALSLLQRETVERASVPSIVGREPGAQLYIRKPCNPACASGEVCVGVEIRVCKRMKYHTTSGAH